MAVTGLDLVWGAEDLPDVAEGWTVIRSHRNWAVVACEGNRYHVLRDGDEHWLVPLCRAKMADAIRTCGRLMPGAEFILPEKKIPFPSREKCKR